MANKKKWKKVKEDKYVRTQNEFIDIVNKDNKFEVQSKQWNGRSWFIYGNRPQFNTIEEAQEYVETNNPMENQE